MGSIFGGWGVTIWVLASPQGWMGGGLVGSMGNVERRECVGCGECVGIWPQGQLVLVFDAVLGAKQ